MKLVEIISTSKKLTINDILEPDFKLLASISGSSNLVDMDKSFDAFIRVNKVEVIDFEIAIDSLRLASRYSVLFRTSDRVRKSLGLPLSSDQPGYSEPSGSNYDVYSFGETLRLSTISKKLTDEFTGLIKYVISKIPGSSFMSLNLMKNNTRKQIVLRLRTKLKSKILIYFDLIKKVTTVDYTPPGARKDICIYDSTTDKKLEDLLDYLVEKCWVDKK